MPRSPRTASSLFLLATLGALSLMATQAVAQVDTSAWTCELCPFEKNGVSGSAEIGAGTVSDRSVVNGDASGFKRKGPYLAAGGKLRAATEDGITARAEAADLGLDIRSLTAEVSDQGRATLRLGYAEIPHGLSDTTRTPFIGVGGNVLTLPAGYPAASTATMPLASTLQDVEIGSKRSRLDLSAAWNVGDNWTHRVTLRHDTRDGTQRSAGSFFSTSAQLVAPLDQRTDVLELSTSYSARVWHASLAYSFSQFSNANSALTWSNPFTPVVTGATRGQLALAPDSQAQHVSGAAGWQPLSWLRASGDVVVGRMTQNESFLPLSLNADLLQANAAALAVPAVSLNGQVDTFNGSLRLSASPLDGLRLNAAYIHDVRDNRTARTAWPAVSTDMFVGSGLRSTQPYDFKQDRVKLDAEYRASAALKAAVGVEQDNRQRSYQEVVHTHETTVWGRVSGQMRPNVSTTLKLAHSQRSTSPYGVASWVDPAENPLLRKFNLASRTRDVGGVRTDIAIGEKVSLGLNAELATDDYAKSLIGLTGSRTLSLGSDLSWAIADETQLHAYVQAERLRSEQAGSQGYGAADWAARTEDRVKLVGIGLRHAALAGKLEVQADVVFSRSHSLVDVYTGATTPPFPTNTYALDSLKLQATYKLQDQLQLVGTLWHQHIETRNWQLDGVQPGTLGNLLALGQAAPQYRVNVVQLAVRHAF